MNKKILSGIMAISLIAVVFGWYWLIPKLLPDFWGMSEWFQYILVLPIVYFICLFFEKKVEQKILWYITLGVIIAIFTDRDLAHSFWYFKIIATLIGTIITFFLHLWDNKREKQEL
ncbi:MAG: hypothetical protein LBE56_03435 [Tannerella sp.]|jgi:hypothetical protein|nr:hypothetical protein [Tannerella sp.]